MSVSFLNLDLGKQGDAQTAYQVATCKNVLSLIINCNAPEKCYIVPEVFSYKRFSIEAQGVQKYDLDFSVPFIRFPHRTET